MGRGVKRHNFLLHNSLKLSFTYYDYRVSEIITRFRKLVQKMEYMGSERYAFQTVYGFTDSNFVRYNTQTPYKPKVLLIKV
jgi:hypothetical protein